MPFQGRMSSFYYSAWQKWDPKKAISGVASVHGLGRDTADNYYSSQTLGYRVIPPWATIKERTSSWGGVHNTDTYKTMEDDDWLFKKALQKKLGKDSYSDTFVSMPTQKSKLFPFTETKGSFRHVLAGARAI